MFQFTALATTCLCIQHGLIREPRDQHSFVSFSKIFADFHALHRLLTPRHPPYALSNLTTYIQPSHNQSFCRSKKTNHKSIKFSDITNLQKTDKPSRQSINQRYKPDHGMNWPLQRLFICSFSHSFNRFTTRASLNPEQ